MKGVFITLEKDGVEVKTQHLGDGKIRWIDGPAAYSVILGRGWLIKTDDATQRALQKLEEVWENFCWGGRVTNTDFMDIAKILRGDA
jgi:hypothetical protein